MAKTNEQQPVELTDAAAELERVGELVALAKAGNRDVLPELRQILDDHPDVWRAVGDLAGRALEHYIQSTVGHDEFSRECLRRQLDDMRAKLLGENPTPLEELIVDRVLMNWIQLQHADLARSIEKDISTRLRDFHERRVNTIQRRYLAAISQVSKIRILLGLEKRVAITPQPASASIAHDPREQKASVPASPPPSGKIDSQALRVFPAEPKRKRKAR